MRYSLFLMKVLMLQIWQSTWFLCEALVATYKWPESWTCVSCMVVQLEKKSPMKLWSLLLLLRTAFSLSKLAWKCSDGASSVVVKSAGVLTHLEWLSGRSQSIIVSYTVKFYVKGYKFWNVVCDDLDTTIKCRVWSKTFFAAIWFRQPHQPMWFMNMPIQSSITDK